MIPVDGVLAGDENQLEFRWKSLKTIYSMVFLFCGTVESCLGTRRLLRLGFNIRYVDGLLFFILAVIRTFIFFRLARNWKDIMRIWSKTENVFLREPYRVKGMSLKFKLRAVFTVLAVLALGK
jgi:gustatory receptor